MGQKSKAKNSIGLSPEDRSLWQRVVDSLQHHKKPNEAHRTMHSTAPFSNEQDNTKDTAKPLKKTTPSPKVKHSQPAKIKKPTIKQAFDAPHDSSSDDELWNNFKATLDKQNHPSDKPAPSKKSTPQTIVHQPAPKPTSAPSPTPSASPSQYSNPFKHHPLEDRIAKKLAKKQVALDGRIDLHGMTQDQAYGALERFLINAQRNNSSIVLVITGKGMEGRGVLRQTVPEWLRSSPFVQMTNGFRHAHSNHGGTGALYVRIRKAKGAR